METVIGIFDGTRVDGVLKTLYDHGFGKSQIKVVDRGRVGEGLASVVVLPTQNSSGAIAAAPTGAIVYDAASFGSTLARLGLSPEAAKFYSEAIQNGSTVVLVGAKNEQAESARQIMRDAHASNVTEPPSDRLVRV